MVNTRYRSILFSLVMLTVLGCMAKTELLIPESFSPQEISRSEYSSAVAKFIVVVDASLSMSKEHGGQVKYVRAAELVRRMNQTLPELEMQGGLMTFGHSKRVADPQTRLWYGYDPYRRSEFQAGLESIERSGGLTPLSAAIDRVADDIAALSGKTAVIIFSDGGAGQDSVVAAKSLKRRFGDRVCIYTVHIGDDAEGRGIMEQIALAGGCGQAFSTAEIDGSAEMTEFVKTVFLTPVAATVAMSDTDNDGIVDQADRCPDTPAGVATNASGCAPDTDKDSIPDYLDQCPGTPMGAAINAAGCWIVSDLQFEFDSAVVKSGSTAGLDEVVAILQNNPGLRVEVQGHTDSAGPSEYNGAL